MRESLETLKSVVGVEGAFFCDNQGHVIESVCDEGLNTDVIGKISYSFSLGVRVARQQGQMPKAIYGTFENGRVVVRPFEKGLLVILGDTSIKQLLLKAALDQAVKNISTMEVKVKETKAPDEFPVSAERLRLDQVLLDQKLLDKWKKDSKETTSIGQVELQTAQGKVAVFRVRVKKGFGEKVGLNSTAIKELGIAEGEKVSVRPVIKLSSEVEDFFG